MNGKSSKILYITGFVDLIMSNMNLLQGFGTSFFPLNTIYSSKRELILKDYMRESNSGWQKCLMLLRVARDRLIYFDIGKQNRR